MQTLQIQLDEEILQNLREQAKQQATSVENVVRNALANYLKPPEPKNYSFIGIGHSGKPNLSTQVDDILEKSNNRQEGWSLPE
jgi:hypothetical protein